MLKSVTRGRPDTAMMSFAAQLNHDDIAMVVDFIRSAFMQESDINTYYHIPANGWKNFQRYDAAFPFAVGDIKLDTPLEQLTPEQRRGRQLYMSGCITCHDRNAVPDQGLIWEPRAVSYPRNNFDHRRQHDEQTASDAMTAATPYARHDQAPQTGSLTGLEQRGETLFQGNCAFCHAADGSGQNWIGSFLEPHPRNLTDPEAMAGMTEQRLRSVIENGLPGTTMSAWKTVLSPDDINAITAYILQWMPSAPHADHLESPTDRENQR